MTSEPVGRICREIQAVLPGVADGTVSRWRGWLVRSHVRRCEGCAEELERQREVTAGLQELGAAGAGEVEAPPDGLLEALLEQAHQPGVRGRAAVPARGAVSGARPALSVVLLVAGAAAGTAVGYASWRGARSLQSKLRGRAGG